MYKEFELIIAANSSDLDTSKLDDESETKAWFASELEWAKNNSNNFREVKD